MTFVMPRMRMVAMSLVVAATAVGGMAMQGATPAAAIDEDPYVLDQSWTDCWDQTATQGCSGDVCWQTLTYGCAEGTRTVHVQTYPTDYCYIGIDDFDYCP